jgi:hypothetical protein
MKPHREILARASLQLSDLAEEFGARGTQLLPIHLKALQNGHVTLAEDVSAEPSRIAATRPVTLLPQVALLCERQRRHAGTHRNQNQNALSHGLFPPLVELNLHRQQRSLPVTSTTVKV